MSRQNYVPVIAGLKCGFVSFATEKGGLWNLILRICWVWKPTRNGMFSSCLIFPFLAFGFMTWMCSSDYSSYTSSGEEFPCFSLSFFSFLKALCNFITAAE
ncbi:hypothetical protein NC652_008534 [Populus alba x Populus x berolinensis]|nr:hypothetical protein NC652_008534 [Populus alba x Populus x berolinensis]